MTWKLTPTTETRIYDGLVVQSCEECKTPKVDATLAAGENTRTGELRLTLHVKIQRGLHAEREALHHSLQDNFILWMKAHSLT